MKKINKTESLKKKIFEKILYGKYNPGDRLPNEREMSELNGYSRTTIRRANNELEKNGIIVRRQGSGTYVAKHRSANKDSGHLIGLLISVNSSFAVDFIRAMEKKISENGDLLVLRLTDNSPELEEKAAIDLVGNGVENLIIWPSGQQFHESTFSRLRVLNTNLVFFDRVIPGDYADYVGLDNDDAMKQLFLKAGKIESPLFLGHSEGSYDSDQRRENAFFEECKKRHIIGKIYRCPEQGAEFNAQIFESCDSVFAVNDTMGEQALPFAGGRPVFGIDGNSTRITTYCQPMEKFSDEIIKLIKKQRDSSQCWTPAKVFLKGTIREKLS